MVKDLAVFGVECCSPEARVQGPAPSAPSNLKDTAVQPVPHRALLRSRCCRLPVTGTCNSTASQQACRHLATFLVNSIGAGHFLHCTSETETAYLQGHCTASGLGRTAALPVCSACKRPYGVPGLYNPQVAGAPARKQRNSAARGLGALLVLRTPH